MLCRNSETNQFKYWQTAITSPLHLKVFDGLVFFQHKEGNLDVELKGIYKGPHKELLLATGFYKCHYLMHR